MMISRRGFLTGCCVYGFESFHRPASHVVAGFAASQLSGDIRRPQFHLLPRANWMNDPNAPIYWNGNYHMFYQYNPDGAVWGNMHWGHALSPDMVHWQHLPIALSPSLDGPDAGGCFSGSAVLDDQQVMVLYTGVVSVPASEATARGAINFKETQCLAVGSGEELLTWTKRPKPVIAAPPADMEVTGFRDPSPWREGDWWYTVLGSGARNKGGAILLYRSKDLRQWEYVRVLTQGEGNHTNDSNPVEAGDMWECPDLFFLGGKAVLIYATDGKVYWECGDVDRKEWVFHARRKGLLDYGPSYYAAKTQLDRMHNRIVWGWLPESRPLEEYRDSGWAGMMSLPRVLTVDADYGLRVEVAPAIEALRQKPQIVEVTGNEEQNQRRIRSMYIEQCCGEVLCRFKRDSPAPFSLSLTSDHPEQCWLTLRYNASQPAKLLVDETLLPLGTGTDEQIEFHLYIDGSAIETFINRQTSYTKRFYPAGSTAPRVGLKIAGRTSDISRLRLWQISPISSDRLTT
ncbi:MAG: glycoside hydrolase family 32 protein [Acidobacteria bacterium]|nr:glycoside hydrolase family 32 protein [Acidobacteriota bacterium]